MWQGVVFDLDGTLVETDSHWRTAKLNLLRAHGFEDERCPELPGGSLADTAGALAAVLGLAQCEGIESELHQRLLAAMTTGLVRPQPGARELLRAVRTAGLPVAIASTSPAELVEVIVGKANLDVAIAVGVSRTLRAKPEPDVYLEACRRLAVEPAACLAVEDSTPGVLAARAAGLAVLTVGPRVSGQGDVHVASLAETPNLDGIVTRWSERRQKVW